MGVHVWAVQFLCAGVHACLLRRRWAVRGRAVPLDACMSAGGIRQLALSGSRLARFMPCACLPLSSVCLQAAPRLVLAFGFVASGGWRLLPVTLAVAETWESTRAV